MTLLHQAAQKAVEALKKVDDALESRGEYVQEISAALVNLQTALRESALQHQEVPREPVADTHIDTLLNALDDVAREYDSYEYGLPMHNSGEADDPLHKLRAAVREWLVASPSTTQQQEAGSELDAMEAHRTNGLAWAVSCWQAEVMNRPLVNVHRRTLDDTWRQVIRYFGGEPDELLGPNHDTLHMRAQEERAWKP